MIEVFGFVHLLGGMVIGKGTLDFVEESFFEGFLQGDFVEAEFFRVGVVFDLHLEAVEKFVGAARSREYLELAFPVGARKGNGEEFFLLFVEGEFVDDAIAAFAGLGVGIGGEGVDARAVGEVEAVLGGGLDEAMVAAEPGEEVDVVACVFEKEFGIGLVATGGPGVEAMVEVADVVDVAEHGDPRPAELTGFDAKFERRIVEDPCELAGKEKSDGTDFGFAGEGRSGFVGLDGECVQVDDIWFCLHNFFSFLVIQSDTKRNIATSGDTGQRRGRCGQDVRQAEGEFDGLMATFGSAQRLIGAEFFADDFETFLTLALDGLGVDGASELKELRGFFGQALKEEAGIEVLHGLSELNGEKEAIEAVALSHAGFFDLVDALFNIVDFEANGFEAFALLEPMLVAGFDPAAEVAFGKAGMAFLGEKGDEFWIRHVVVEGLVDQGADVRRQVGDFAAVWMTWATMRFGKLWREKRWGVFS